MLVSLTLSNNQQDLIEDALRSVVDHVDACILIDTGITDNTITRAKKVAGEKLRLHAFPWNKNFADARNFSLLCAKKLNADWALILDTDERLLWRAPLQLPTDHQVVLAPFIDGSDHKDRLFRVSGAGSFVGYTHEYYLMEGTRGLTETLAFTEVPKRPEEAVEKFTRDVSLLQDYSSLYPDEARWYYYLGDSYNNLKDYQNAVRAYRRCIEKNGWAEESAWACYKLAGCYVELGKPEEALEACTAGLILHPGMAELCWYAGYICYQSQLPAKAVGWELMAISLGLFAGEATFFERIGFRHLPALFEGPYDVLRFAYRALGYQQRAEEATRHYEHAKRLREEFHIT